MKSFRKILFWMHLSAGVTVGLVIFYLSVTGILMAFKPQILEWNLPAVLAQTSAQKLGSDQLVEAFSKTHPETEISALTLYKNRDFAEIQAGKNKFLVNAFNAEILEQKNPWLASFFNSITNLHRWFSVNNSGDHQSAKAFKGFCMIIFILMIGSGIYLWWPQALFFFNFKLMNKAKRWNQHNVIGFWSSPLLLVTAVTGLIMAHQWANNLLYTFTGSPVPVSGEKKNEAKGAERKETASFQNLQKLFDEVGQKAPDWISVSLKTKDDLLSVNIEQPVAWEVTSRSSLLYNPLNGEVSKWEPFAEQNLGRRIRQWMKPLHTGEAAGFLGQFLISLSALGGIMLSWTGLRMSYSRFSQFRKASKKENSSL